MTDGQDLCRGRDPDELAARIRCRGDEAGDCGAMTVAVGKTGPAFDVIPTSIILPSNRGCGCTPLSITATRWPRPVAYRCAWRIRNCCCTGGSPASSWAPLVPCGWQGACCSTGPICRVAGLLTRYGMALTLAGLGTADMSTAGGTPGGRKLGCAAAGHTGPARHRTAAARATSERRRRPGGVTAPGRCGRGPAHPAPVAALRR